MCQIDSTAIHQPLPRVSPTDKKNRPAKAERSENRTNKNGQAINRQHQRLRERP